MTTKTHDDATGLDELDVATHPARDATHVRAIIAASEDVSVAEATLRAAVRDARKAGDSWSMIGAALGVSRQAAQQRFGRHAA
ncbi:MAG: hypothetical protein QM611_02265 [Microbacterium sp.]|uniref:hypothetical protein n=1 Tax=Microbacterium sp. TaxID=51671 RepID=UPI0039E4551E